MANPPVTGRQPVQLGGATMGTRWQAICVPPEGQGAWRGAGTLQAAAQAAVDAVDAQMSNWKPGSDLSRFNAAPPGAWIEVPTDLARVIAAGQGLAHDTRGAFDMTLGKAVAAWGFGPAPRPTPPPSTEWPGLRGQYQALKARLTPPALRKTAPLSLDLSGIAKGFGVDRIAEVLAAHGITDYFVVIDGEIRLSGRKPGAGGPWRVALEAPIAGQREVYDIMEPAPPCALATSGDYRHFHAHAGCRYSHTIDGRRGAPVENTVASVTVAGQSCMMADAWASALMVLGPHDGVALAQARNICARFLIREVGEAGLRDVICGGFERVIG